MQIAFVNQPFCGQELVLGQQLRDELGADPRRFERFLALVAYAKRSGVLRLRNAIETFRVLGGRARAVVGLDQEHTTREALQLLLQICDEVFVYCDEAPYRTWHPKAYVFEAKEQALIFLGSSNLTAGGLFSNYEANVKVRLDLTQAPDQSFLEEVETAIHVYTDTESDLCRRLDQDFLERLVVEGYIASEEAVPREGRRRVGRTDRGGEVQNLFGTANFAAPPPPDQEETEEVPVTEQERAVSEGQAAEQIEEEVTSFWKRLSRNDVSLRGSPGQIIIPKAFRELFPATVQTREADEGGKGRQWECTLSVRYRDEASVQDVPAARFIIYEPKADHPRPNIESRFTFRTRGILESLREGDVLVFRRTPQGPHWFEIERIPVRSRRQAEFPERKRFGLS